MPEPKTAIVLLSFLTATSWAIEAIPRASPLKTILSVCVIEVDIFSAASIAACAAECCVSERCPLANSSADALNSSSRCFTTANAQFDFREQCNMVQMSNSRLRSSFPIQDSN